MADIIPLMSQLTVQQAFRLAMQQHEAGKVREAEQLYRQILAAQPAHAGALHFLGVLAHQRADHAQAIDLMRKAIQISPNVPEAYNNLGIALEGDRQPDAAIEAYRQAIALRPNFAGAYSNLGNALKSKGRLDDAIAAYRQAIALNPDHAGAYNNLGKALKDKAMLDESIVAFRRAIEIKPSDAVAHSNLICTLYFHAAYDAESIAREHRQWNLQHAQPIREALNRTIRQSMQSASAGSGRGHGNDRNPDRRLRIGYVSPDFREHCQSLFTVPLLSAHDPEQVEVFCYSDVMHADEMTRKLQGYAHAWRNIAGKSDQQVADLIGQDRIDILVDLTMHMSGNRLLVFARKPAPVQVCWLAYPGSTGVSEIGYRLTDPYLDPAGPALGLPNGVDESVYSEKTIRLPDSFWCYEPQVGRELSVSALPALKNIFITFGSLNNFCKVNDAQLAVWAQVLRQVRNSRLVMLSDEGSHRQRALDRLQDAGVDAGRIEFVAHRPRRAYLQQYNRIDIGLDTFPSNGHTTSLDSFWMGVPVVTRVGQTAVSRAGWCQLSNLGLTELAAADGEQFVRIAVELANRLPRLQTLRSTLRDRMEQSPLMDAPRFSRNIEAIYRRIWRAWCGIA